MKRTSLPTAIMNIDDEKIRVKITSVKKLVELSKYFKRYALSCLK